MLQYLEMIHLDFDLAHGQEFLKTNDNCGFFYIAGNWRIEFR